MAISATTETPTATAAATARWPTVARGGTHAQIGSLRKMGRGMCRSTDISTANLPGRPDQVRPFAAEVTASSATSSALTVNGAPWRRWPPVFQGGGGAHLAGPDHQDVNPVLPQRFPRSR